MRSTLLLIIGAIIGILLAATGLLESKNNLLITDKSDSVAEVNGVYIPNSQFISIAKGIAENKKSSMKQEDYDYILQKLIDEELLVQRGQELGLLQLNSVLRNNMTQAVTTSILSENANLEASEAELKIFYESNKNFFRSTTKIHFQIMHFTSKEQAEIALQALADGKAFLEVKERFADKEVMSIPNKLLDLNSIRQYIGPSLTEKLAQQPIHTLSPLIEQNNTWYLFTLQEKELGEAPNFESIQDIVSAQFKRQANEKTLHNYLLWLRKRASIEKTSSNELKEMSNKAVN